MQKMNVLNAVRMFAVCGVLIAAHGCDDENTPLTQEEEIEITRQSSVTETTIEEDVQDFGTILKETDADGGRLATSCVDVTRDAGTKTITLDFGEGCVGPHGRERSGKVLIQYSGVFDDDEANRVISFDDYLVNDNQITGQIELRDFNLNEEGNLTFTRKFVDYTVHFSGGDEFHVNGNTTVEWTEGHDDDDRSNDVFSVTGSYTGESSRGRKVEFEIIEPVIARFPCRAEGNFLRVAGQTEFRITNVKRERVRTVDYGDGQCDRTITVTINNRTFPITL